MSIKSLIRKITKGGDAVYWPPGVVNENNEDTLGTAVPLKVRWDDEQEEYIDRNGEARVSRAKIILAPDQDVEFGGVMWRGKLADLPDPTHPRKNPGALEIRGIMRNPDFKQKFTIVTVWL